MSSRLSLLLLVILAVVPAVGLVFYTDAEQRQLAAVRVQEDARRLARLASIDETRLVEEARRLLLVAAQLPEVSGGDFATCSDLFADLLKQYPLYVNMGAVDQDGDTFCSALPLAEPVNASDRGWFQRAVRARGFAVGDYQVDRDTGKATVNFGYPVLDETDAVQAVVFAVLELSWLNQLAARVELPPGSTLTVIDRAGTILARSPDPQKPLGQSMPEPPVARAILTRGEGIIEAAGVDGIPRLYAFTPLRGAPVTGDAYISIGIPKEVAFADANRTLARNLAGVGLAAAMALAAAWIGGRRFLLRRGKALLTAATRLRAGDLSARSGVPYGAGELSQLARVFDEMAADLQAREVEAGRAEGGLRDSEQRYRLFFERSPRPMWVYDLQTFAFLAVNDAAVRHYGYSREEFLAMTAKDILPREEIPAFLEAGLGAAGVRRHLKKDGTIIDVETVSRTLVLAGKPAELVLANDITERKRADEESQRQRELLAQREGQAAMDQRLASLAHDLRNSLSVVIGHAFLLRKAVREGPLADRAEKIAEAAERCTRTLENFLAPAGGRPEAAPVAVPEPSAVEAPPAHRGRAILVVDDDPLVVELLAEALSADGHQVETAPNGAVALDKLREQAYDLVVSDIRMPELDGPGLWREVERRHPALRRRFIFITGDTLNPGTRKFLEQTGAPSLNKPFVLDELRRAIRRILEA